LSLEPRILALASPDDGSGPWASLYRVLRALVRRLDRVQAAVDVLVRQPGPNGCGIALNIDPHPESVAGAKPRAAEFRLAVRGSE
jgi:hypothetical protein